jgi:hypothetical protein
MFSSNPLIMKKQIMRAAASGWILAFLIFAFVFFVLSSCDMNPALDDVSSPKLKDESSIIAKPISSVFLLPATVGLNKVELYLEKGSATTGKVYVDIKDGSGTLIGSTGLAASSVITGGAWNTFNFTTPLTLTRGQKYRIHLRRSDVHNYPAGNYIFWRTSSGGVDAYPDGINDVYPSWTLDYAFKTYTEGALDQQQTLTTYGFAVGNIDSRWQEFLADYPKVSQRYIALNFDKGASTTGTVTVQIRNADGSVVIAQNIVSASGLPNGNAWVTFKLAASLYRDQPYRIYVTRSDAHNYAANNYIFWRCSSGGVDAYPDGVNDVYPSWKLDYAFRTYNAIIGLDQHQDLINYGFFTSNTFYRWQEFVPRNP